MHRTKCQYLVPGACFVLLKLFDVFSPEKKTQEQLGHLAFRTTAPLCEIKFPFCVSWQETALEFHSKGFLPGWIALSPVSHNKARCSSTRSAAPKKLGIYVVLQSIRLDGQTHQAFGLLRVCVLGKIFRSLES